jgi:microcompartment protein CcmK/EutM
MRIGVVTGTVVLSRADSALDGTRFLVVNPVTAVDLAAGGARGSGRELIVADHLGAGVGKMIAFVEGREAANPYYPGRAAVDAYCSLIVETVNYEPPSGNGSDRAQG